VPADRGLIRVIRSRSAHWRRSGLAGAGGDAPAATGRGL